MNMNMNMNIERFQNNNLSSGNELLDSAYSDNSMNIISNNSVFGLGNNSALENTNNSGGDGNGGGGSDYHEHVELEDSKFDFNIWDLLGVKSMGEDKHNCLFDCAIKSVNSMETCNGTTNKLYDLINYKNKDNCKLKSYKTALECSKQCYNLSKDEEYSTPNNLLSTESSMMGNVKTKPVIKTQMETSPVVTSSSSAENILDRLKFPDHQVPGFNEGNDIYSPYDEKYWANSNDFGLNLDNIVDYNNNLGNEVIEVQSSRFFPKAKDKTYL
jgi:hypothetical protein